MPAQPFEEIRAQVDRVVRKVFPKAKRSAESGMEGWAIPRPEDAPRPTREGTMPGDRIMVLLADRKAGPTLHVWYPGDARGLRAHEAELSAAGFKVMVGCLVFSRKQPYPVDAVETLLRRLKERDAGG